MKRQAQPWRPIDMELLRDSWRIYLSDPVLAACRSVVINELLAMGVVYTDPNYSRLPSEEFFHHVQRHFTRFCKDIIDCIYVQVRAGCLLAALARSRPPLNPCTELAADGFKGGRVRVNEVNEQPTLSGVRRVHGGQEDGHPDRGPVWGG